MKITFIKYGFIFSIFLLSGCEEFLKEDVYTQIAPDNLLTNEAGIYSVLTSAYGYTNEPNRQRINAEEWPTDIAYQTGGFENGRAVLFLDFTWDASVDILNTFYTHAYQGIRDANVLLENIDQAEIPGPKKLMFIAEARFLRALNYIRLYNYFGPVPLRKRTSDELEMARPGEEEFQSFIVSELLGAIDDLPNPGEEEAYGRATSGAARGILCKYYLNTKQWAKAAEMAGDIIDMNYYQLFPVYEDLLKVSNEGNLELIWINATNPLTTGWWRNNYMPCAFPPAFQAWPEKNLEWQSNWQNPQSQYRLRDDFYHSFDENDTRRDIILTQYINMSGDTVDLLESVNNTRSFRYWPDPDAQGERNGNDVPEVRYADILLSRAEALNELNGPNQESIDLINEVRARAGVPDLLLSDFASKTALREHLIKERSWEFYSEGMRRQDLIRMGKFIEYAIDRGVTIADAHHRRYPIPLQAIDSNPMLEQNEGY